MDSGKFHRFLIYMSVILFFFQSLSFSQFAKLMVTSMNVMRGQILDYCLLQEIYKDANTQVHTLRKMVKEKEEAIQRQSTLEKKIHELEKQGTIKIQKKGDGDIAILPVMASGTLSVGSEVVAGNYVGPVTGAASSGPLPPPPPPLPPPSDTPEAGKKPR
jgi:hypothetical protein